MVKRYPTKVEIEIFHEQQNLLSKILALSAEENISPDLENLIISLCKSNPQLIAMRLSHSIEKTPNLAFVKLLLKHIEMNFFCEEKITKELFSNLGNRVTISNVATFMDSNVWPLIRFLLINNDEITQSIIEHPSFKDISLHLLDTLIKYNEFSRYWLDRPAWAWEPPFNRPQEKHYAVTKKAIADVILKIASFEKEDRPLFDRMRTQLEKKLSFRVKRYVEERLCEQIRQLNTKDAVYAFYKQYGDAFYLNHHRHRVYDCVRGVLFPEIKTNILTQLQTRMASMTDVVPQTEEVEISKLAQLKEVLRKLLVIKYNALFHSSVGFFNSARLTQEKKEEISQVSRKLISINTVDEFRFFVASLMTNAKLVGSRGLGVGLSDTALKLKNFYDEQFLATETAPIHKTAVIPLL